MKKVLNILAVALIATSCEFLDVEPLGQPSDTPEYYNELVNSQQAVNSIYSALSRDYDIHLHHWYFGEVMSDNAWKGGSSWADTEELQDLVEWRGIASSVRVRTLWERQYQGIYRANLCIDRISKSDLPEKERNYLLGEARFLRGYAYFYLAKMFGDVPLFEEPVELSQLGKVERTPFDKVLSFVREDFEEASKLLGKKSEMETGRATWGAAKAYLARCIMYEIGMFKTLDESSWQDVYNITDEIIKSNEYTLKGVNLAQVLDISGENGPESIFEWQYIDSPLGGGSSSCITLQPRGGDGISGWGWGLMCPTQDLVDEFETDDPRLNYTVGRHGEYAFGIQKGLDSSNPAITEYFPRKMLLDDSFRPKQNKQGPLNKVMFRYADIILMNAEAAYHLNKPVSEIVGRLNEVRSRAREMTYPKGYFEGDNSFKERPLPHIYPQDLPETLSGEELYEAILHERRVELALEGLRYFDLIRTGRYEQALLKSDFGYLPGVKPETVLANYKTHLLRGVPVLPIPEVEVSTYGLKQNPGYN